MKGLQKCVVVDVKGRNVYLMAKGGSFYRIPWRGTVPEVGDEVFVSPPSRFASLSRVAQGALVACLALFLIIGSAAVGYHSAPRAAAYVSVDINPSVEMLLSTKNKVMKATPLNRDGARILKEVRLLGLSGEQAVRVITLQAAQDGYLRPAWYNVVLIAVTPLKGKEITPGLEKKLAGEAYSVLNTHHLRGKAQGIETTPEVRNRARKLGLSPGKYAVLVESLNSDLKVSPEMLKEKSISQVLQEAGGNVSNILSSITNGLLEDKENSLKTKLRQQPVKQDNDSLDGLLEDILSHTVSGVKNTSQSSNNNARVPEERSGPLPEIGYQEQALTETGKNRLPLEKTLEPVKDNIIKPIDENVITPLDNLLGNLLGDREQESR